MSDTPVASSVALPTFLDLGRPSRTPRVATRTATVAWVLALCTFTVRGQNVPSDLTQVSLEDLVNMEVTSVSKKQGKLVRAPAAIYVITQEDIRRSGLTSIPEILRLAPGLDVAQIDGNRWAISARGFNRQFSNKLLVLIDGRSVYLAGDSGVFWNEQDTLIEDIDRIEIIRGPGATLWGANAVNGVINIITKPAANTQGGLVTAVAGNSDHTDNGVRYGGTLGKLGAYRIYSKYFRRADLPELRDKKRDDGWTAARGGFRADLHLSDQDSLTVQGDIYRDTAGIGMTLPNLTPPFESEHEASERDSGQNFMATWTHRHSDESVFTLKAYFDRNEENSDLLVERRGSFNVDFQHAWTPSARHEIVWGLGLRYNASSYRNSTTLAFLPEHRRDRLFSAFLQDEIHLVPNRLSVIVGSKVEQNEFTGLELQPGARLLWTPSSRSTVWAAVSRAVRTPSYFDEGSRLIFAAFPTNTGAVGVTQSFGSTNGVSETVRAHEVGYRSQLNRRFSIDWTAFYNTYRHLKTYEPGQPFFSADSQPPHLVLPLILENGMRGESEGAEVTANWEVTRRWRISPSYSWLNLQLHMDSSSRDNSSEAQEGQSPQHQIQLRSQFDLSRHLQFDSSLYYVSALPTLSVRAYTRVDARLAWRPVSPIEISLAGQNLQGGKHLEYISEGPFSASRLARTVYARITWTF